eukprot:CAMPEP_0177417662 /NCGR_PEP_ID=MMETSP0368-20130122/68781_1 /TAXON_ID=447022 ORGANISM="Scrippsiella hangoei-like, Strain SHHI-4" /NCGR_SAMPLE_ID=MMETSP0368 /ASSEMBLY_ACC=CAM_ASM_000363 /LENGTH=296 /DNA_ID=CAMNT_0018887281 /DNA_START=101 /DNA_END=990 /DNA_ORIENTATION=+
MAEGAVEPVVAAALREEAAALAGALAVSCGAYGGQRGTLRVGRALNSAAVVLVEDSPSLLGASSPFPDLTTAADTAGGAGADVMAALRRRRCRTTGDGGGVGRGGGVGDEREGAVAAVPKASGLRRGARQPVDKPPGSADASLSTSVSSRRAVNRQAWTASSAPAAGQKSAPKGTASGATPTSAARGVSSGGGDRPRTVAAWGLGYRTSSSSASPTGDAAPPTPKSMKVRRTCTSSRQARKPAFPDQSPPSVSPMHCLPNKTSTNKVSGRIQWRLRAATTVIEGGSGNLPIFDRCS